MRDKRNRRQSRRFLSHHVCLQEKSECGKFFLLLAFVLVSRIYRLPNGKSWENAYKNRIPKSDSLKGAFWPEQCCSDDIKQPRAQSPSSLAPCQYIHA